jgi:hypothetical protein
MSKNQNTFAKRQREYNKKQKQEEKRQRKLQKLQEKESGDGRPANDGPDAREQELALND